MSKQLTDQIVLRVLADIGVSNLDKPEIWSGLGSEILLSNKTIKIKYPEQEVCHALYVGKLLLNSFDMKGLLVNLSHTGNEVLFVFRSGDKPIHAISCADEGDLTFIKIYNEKSNIWKDTTVQMQAMILSGFEQLTSLGILWDVCDNYNDLYSAAVNLISILD